MNALREKLRLYLNGPMVRPLGLLGPILVLLIALPLLRPLRHPGETEISNDELLRLASIRALVEHHSLTLDHGFNRIPGTVVVDANVYSAQSPMLALLLWPPAWLLTRLGFSFDANHLLIEYLLTMLGAALPVAAAAGLAYKMGRLFELRRGWRVLLGIGVVAGSGLLSYSVVLNQQAPAAALVMLAAACLIHVSSMEKKERRGGWFAMAGASAAMACTIEPAAAIFPPLFACVILAMRFSFARRLLGLLLYVLGVIPIISVHYAWNHPITGDILPASLHAALHTPTIVAAPPDDLSEDEPQVISIWDKVGSHIMWGIRAMFGGHGLLSHFPVMLLGVMGIGAVMHRHWPGAMKTLAAACGIAALVIIVLYRLSNREWSSAMFATRWFVVFSPMLLFWMGAWLRRTHTPTVWGLAAVLLVFSMLVGLIGATGPTPREGFRGYTAVDALRKLVQHDPADSSGALAGRVQ